MSKKLEEQKKLREARRLHLCALVQQSRTEQYQQLVKFYYQVVKFSKVDITIEAGIVDDEEKPLRVVVSEPEALKGICDVVKGEMESLEKVLGINKGAKQ